MAAIDLTAERLRELFSYDPDTGLFTRIVKSPYTKIGDVPKCTNRAGYVVFRVDKVLLRAHRLAWLYVYGKWPTDQIDHINGIPSDNRMVNLRECTNAENAQNLPVRTNNKSGFTGVSYSKKSKCWQAFICVHYKSIHLGRYENPELAQEAYLQAKAQMHTFQPTLRVTA